MYDFNEGLPLSGLLEQLKGAAVMVGDYAVIDFNRAAKLMLPELEEYTPYREPADGVIEIMGARFDAACFELGEYKIFTFAMPAENMVAEAAPLLENVEMAVRNSLNISFTASELIGKSIDKDDPEQLRTYNAILRHEQYRLLNIADNIRELCRLTSRDDVLNFDLVTLDELCAETLENVSSLVFDKGLKFVYSSEVSNCVIRGDETRIEAMLLAVLANSVASCSEGCTISLSIKKRKEQCIVEIEDDGAGIADDKLGDIFEEYAKPFLPGDMPRGLGLSMSVARNIALRHGGRFLLESKPGEGTKVTIQLPVSYSKQLTLRSPKVKYGGKSMRPLFTAFADVLDYKYFSPPYM